MPREREEEASRSAAGLEDAAHFEGGVLAEDAAEELDLGVEIPGEGYVVVLGVLVQLFAHGITSGGTVGSRLERAARVPPRRARSGTRQAPPPLVPPKTSRSITSTMTSTLAATAGVSSSPNVSVSTTSIA